MPIGTIKVEFAGSREEAHAYAEEHGLKAPNSIGLSSNGYAHLTAPFANQAEYEKNAIKLAELGWDIGCQMVSVRTNKKK